MDLTLEGALLFSHRFDTEIEIDATPAQVWAVLTDFVRYGEWNPFMVSSQGSATVGTRLVNVMRDASGSDMTFRPTVTVVRPERELRWLGRLGLPGLFDGEHWFTIEEIAAGRVRLRQGEDFGGMLVPFLRGKLERGTLPQFHAMNRALAERVAQHRAA